jgi:hypothetical protein
VSVLLVVDSSRLVANSERVGICFICYLEK